MSDLDDLLKFAAKDDDGDDERRTGPDRLPRDRTVEGEVDYVGPPTLRQFLRLEATRLSNPSLLYHPSEFVGWDDTGGAVYLEHPNVEGQAHSRAAWQAWLDAAPQSTTKGFDWLAKLSPEQRLSHQAEVGAEAAEREAYVAGLLLDKEERLEQARVNGKTEEDRQRVLAEAAKRDEASKFEQPNRAKKAASKSANAPLDPVADFVALAYRHNNPPVRAKNGLPGVKGLRPLSPEERIRMARYWNSEVQQVFAEAYRNYLADLTEAWDAASAIQRLHEALLRKL